MWVSLLVAYVNYTPAEKAMEKCQLLLEKLRASSCEADFKEYFERVWADKVSKLHEAHIHYAVALRSEFLRSLAGSKVVDPKHWSWSKPYMRSELLMVVNQFLSERALDDEDFEEWLNKHEEPV